MKNRRPLWIYLPALLALVVAGLVVRQYRGAGAGDLLRVGTADEIRRHIGELKSPLVLVNFWASWCEPCKQEFPSLLTVRERYAGQGLRVVFVSIDENGDRPAAERFLKLNHVDFPTFFRGEQSLRFVSEFYPGWSGAIPMSLLIGPDLKVLEAWEGDTSLEDFETRVKRHLKGS